MTYDHLRDCIKCKKITIREMSRFKGVVACSGCGVKALTKGVPRDGNVLIVMEEAMGTLYKLRERP